MRVWPFRRRAPAGEGPQERLALGPAGRGRAGWRGLPPVQRAVGAAAPLTVEVAAFEAALATRRRPGLVGPLEHAVAPDAPAGTAHGLAAPVAPGVQRAPGGDLALAPRQPGPGRPAPPGTAGASRAGSSTAVEAEAPAEAEASGVAPAPVEVEALGVAPAPAPRPLVTAPAPPLPRLHLPPVPTPVVSVQRDAEPPGQPAPGPSPPATAAEPGDVQRAVVGPVATQPSSDPAVPSRPPLPTPPPRRLGLGEPLAHRPTGTPPGPPTEPSAPEPAAFTFPGMAPPEPPGGSDTEPGESASGRPDSPAGEAAVGGSPEPTETRDGPGASRGDGGAPETAALLADRPLPEAPAGATLDPAVQRAPASDYDLAAPEPPGPGQRAPLLPGAAPSPRRPAPASPTQDPAPRPLPGPPPPVQRRSAEPAGAVDSREHPTPPSATLPLRGTLHRRVGFPHAQGPGDGFPHAEGAGVGPSQAEGLGVGFPHAEGPGVGAHAEGPGVGSSPAGGLGPAGLVREPAAGPPLWEPGVGPPDRGPAAALPVQRLAAGQLAGEPATGPPTPEPVAGPPTPEPAAGPPTPELAAAQPALESAAGAPAGKPTPPGPSVAGDAAPLVLRSSSEPLLVPRSASEPPLVLRSSSQPPLAALSPSAAGGVLEPVGETPAPAAVPGSAPAAAGPLPAGQPLPMSGMQHAVAATGPPMSGARRAAGAAGLLPMSELGPATGAVGPLLGGRPLPVSGVQRATDTVPPGLGAALAGHLGADLTGVAVHRDGPAGRSADELQARAFTTAGEVHLPARQGPLEAQPGRALLAHELVHVAQQRLLGPARPAEQTPAGQDLERQAVAVERAVAGHGEPEPAAGPAAGFPLAQLPAAEMLDPRSTALASGAARLDADGSVVFRPPPGAPPGLAQRAPEEPTTPVPTALEPTAPEPTAPEPPPAAGAPAGDLDELARRLYERIRLRLKAELRLDRERSGHLTDLRH